MANSTMSRSFKWNTHLSLISGRLSVGSIVKGSVNVVAIATLFILNIWIRTLGRSFRLLCMSNIKIIRRLLSKEKQREWAVLKMTLSKIMCHITTITISKEKETKNMKIPKIDHLGVKDQEKETFVITTDAGTIEEIEIAIETEIGTGIDVMIGGGDPGPAQGTEDMIEIGMKIVIGDAMTEMRNKKSVVVITMVDV